MLAALSFIYAGEYDRADAHMKYLSTGLSAETSGDIFARTDMRKFMLAALRDYYAKGHDLTRETAEHLAQFSRLFDPQSSNVFDPAPCIDGEVPLTTYAYERQAPDNLKIGLYFRSKFYPTSRPHDLAYRFHSAFVGAGAKSEIAEPDREPDRFVDCDIALVDDPHIFRKSQSEKRAFLEGVRKHTKCMVMVEMDPWAAGRRERAEANADIYDRVWAMMPSLLGSDGKIGGMAASTILFPVGAPEVFTRYRREDSMSPGDAISFCGGVEEYNFYRYFWIVGARSLHHAPEIRVTNHSPDDLSIEESLGQYVKRLAASHACLNFVRRATGEVSMVGRTSDALCLRQLLVQEASAEVRPYLKPGEHFLQFRALDELDDICGRLMADRREFEDVRLRGAAYFDAHYSDDAIVRHIATWR